MADAPDDQGQYQPQRSKDQQQHRPDRRPLTRRKSHEDDRGHVLHDEDPHRNAAVQRARLSSFFEHLDDEDSAREPHRKRDQKSLAVVDVGKEGPTQKCQRMDCRSEYQNDYRHVRAGAGPDLRAREGPDVEFQARKRQQQSHAYVRPRLSHLPADGPVQVDQEASRQKADQRRQPDSLGAPAQHK